jgi:excisionase family DNA binding protein
VARRLGVCHAVVYRLIREGRLGHVRVASAVRVRLADLKLFEQLPPGK